MALFARDRRTGARTVCLHATKGGGALNAPKTADMGRTGLFQPPSRLSGDAAARRFHRGVLRSAGEGLTAAYLKPLPLLDAASLLADSLLAAVRRNLLAGRPQGRAFCLAMALPLCCFLSQWRRSSPAADRRYKVCLQAAIQVQLTRHTIQMAWQYRVIGPRYRTCTASKQAQSAKHFCAGILEHALQRRILLIQPLHAIGIKELSGISGTLHR